MRDSLNVIEISAREWASARAAVVNLPLSAPDYREKLSALSEAEDRLARAAGPNSNAKISESSATSTSGLVDTGKSGINELAGEASAYTSEVHRAAAQAVSRARLDKSHQTTPSELCVVPAVTGGPANPSITEKLSEALREIEHAESVEIARGLDRAALSDSGGDHEV